MTGINDLRVTALRDEKWTWVMVYTPTGKPFTINASKLNKSAKAKWLNPLNGEYSPANLPAGGLSDKTTFTPPTDQSHPDWVLVVESKCT